MEEALAELKKRNEQLQQQLDVLALRLDEIAKLEKQVRKLNDVEEIKVLMNKFGASPL